MLNKQDVTTFVQKPIFQMTTGQKYNGGLLLMRGCILERDNNYLAEEPFESSSQIVFFGQQSYCGMIFGRF